MNAKLEFAQQLKTVIQEYVKSPEFEGWTNTPSDMEDVMFQWDNSEFTEDFNLLFQKNEAFVYNLINEILATV